jgi:hypothetical protein
MNSKEPPAGGPAAPPSLDNAVPAHGLLTEDEA